MSKTPFGLYAEFYDLLYQDKDYESELRYVRELLDQHIPQMHSILEIGCGTGKHALSFAQHGISVLGIDRSIEMLAQANKRVRLCSSQIKKLLRFEHTDLESLRIEEKFDAVISLFHVFSYCASDHSIDCFFKAANRHLPSGGGLFFDCWYGPAVIADPPQKRIKEVENQTHKVTRNANPTFEENNALVNIAYELVVKDKRTEETSSLCESHLMRHFTVAEVEKKLDENGFRLELALKWMTDESPDETDWSACFLAIKN
jgi:SAM-dependent methyltransferase